MKMWSVLGELFAFSKFKREDARNLHERSE